MVTDPRLRRLPPVSTVLESLENNGIEFCVFDSVRVEPFSIQRRASPQTVAS
jgi:alcohol dehydrogenase class IV